jgi:hypothetical protein
MSGLSSSNSGINSGVSSGSSNSGSNSGISSGSDNSHNSNVIYERIIDIESAKRLIPLDILNLDKINLLDIINDFTAGGEGEEERDVDLYSIRSAIFRMFDESVEKGGGKR